MIATRRSVTRPSLFSPSRLVPRVQPLGPVKRERAGVVLVGRGERLEQMADVVAERGSLQHPSGKPAPTGVEDGQPGRSGVPAAASELVDLVTGLRAEQLGQVTGGVRQEVNGKRVGGRRQAGGVVLVRERNQER